MTRTSLGVCAAVLMIAGASAASAATAPAVDAGPVRQNSKAMATADQMPAMNMRQQLQDQLSKAGLTNITVTPSSFYVHATNKQGDPVAMVIGPEGFTEVTELPVKTTASSDATATKPMASVSATPAPTPVPVPATK